MKGPGATKFYTLAFGLFLGLCIWKFGNPVILDSKITAPVSAIEFWNEPWPLHWANWILLPLSVIGAILIWQQGTGKPTVTNSFFPSPFSRLFWLLPLVWLGWQFISATRTVDADLTAATLWQFSGCVACYFLGVRLFARENLTRWLLAGLLAAFAFCLVRAVDQKVFEFPLDHRMLVEGEHGGWTNFSPETIAGMKHDKIIITNNGMDVANPVILKKFQQGRVSGTLVYPNALAGIVLLLWPASLALAFGATKKLKPPIRFAAITLAVFLGGVAFFWSGSKLGWLIGIGIAGLFLPRLDWPKKLKLTAVATVLVLGLGIFAIRFHHYFATGATSAGARLDYWRAAAQTTATHPLFGTGPGTFQRPYSQIKSPDSEMARLAHNDYLEQFSDSGLIGGISYAAWIILALITIGEKLWQHGDPLTFSLFAGLFGWFVQGLGEFGLYVPALAWTAFSLLGALLSGKRIEFDNKSEIS